MISLEVRKQSSGEVVDWGSFVVVPRAGEEIWMLGKRWRVTSVVHERLHFGPSRGNHPRVSVVSGGVTVYVKELVDRRKR